MAEATKKATTTKTSTAKKTTTTTKPAAPKVTPLLEREPQRVLQLRDLAALFLDLARRRGLDTGLAAGSPVIPVIVGNSVDSLQLSRALYDRGINVQPILRPAVPERSISARASSAGSVGMKPQSPNSVPA